MELKDFVKDALVQISQGVADAVAECSKLDAIVNPSETFGENGEYYMTKVPGHGPMRCRVQMVAMDIEVKVCESTSKEGKETIGVKDVLGVGGVHSSEQGKSSTSRIRFSVPICLPCTPIGGI